MATFSKSPRFPEQNHISGIPRPKSRVSKTVALVDEDESDYSLVLPRHLYAGCTPFKTEDVGHAKLFEPKDHRMGAQSGLKEELELYKELVSVLRERLELAEALIANYKSAEEILAKNSRCWD